MGRRVRFEEITLPGTLIGENDERRFMIARLAGFDNAIEINTYEKAKTYRHQNMHALRRQMGEWLDANVMDDYLFFTRAVLEPAPNGKIPQWKMPRVYCFKDHRDAMNFKIHWG